jgi:hypothetical protein
VVDVATLLEIALGTLMSLRVLAYGVVSIPTVIPISGPFSTLQLVVYGVCLECIFFYKYLVCFLINGKVKCEAKVTPTLNCVLVRVEVPFATILHTQPPHIIGSHS